MHTSKPEPNVMHWRCYRRGNHTHIIVFINGAKAGDLVFRNEEFEQLYRDAHKSGNITFEESNIFDGFTSLNPRSI